MKQTQIDLLPSASINEAIQILEDYYILKAPVFLYGKPGVGKTAIAKLFVKQLAKKYNEPYQLITIYPSQLDSVDVKGVPTISKIKIKQATVDPSTDTLQEQEKTIPITEWAMPNFFPLDPKAKGVIFLDECLLAPPAVQHAIMPLILEREINGVKLPEGFWTLAAGNRKQDGVEAQNVSPAFNNRFYLHLVIEPNPDEVIDYFTSSGFDYRITAFLRQYPNYINNLDPKSNTHAQAWASQRSWEFLSNVLKLPHNQEKPITYLSKQILGCVGPVAGQEFITFCQYSHLIPTVEEIVKNPNTADIPDLSKDLSIGYIITSKLINACIADKTKIKPCGEYIARFTIDKPDNLDSPLGDLGALFVSAVTKHHSVYIINNVINEKSKHYSARFEKLVDTFVSFLNTD